MAGPELLPVVERHDSKAAIVFVHGFGGDAATTWGRLPTDLRDAPALSDWSIYSLGYSSKLAPDFRGVWTGDPGIETLATYLNTRATQKPLKSMRSLAFIAHSMGGLVVEKALVDFPDLVDRVSHVLLYGTPSGGLERADGLLARLFKRQVQDMGLQSGFISNLRSDWRESFGDVEVQRTRPFGFWVIAGDRDEFVPATSSLGPFAKDDAVVVPGNHLEMVDPAAADSMSVQTAIDAIVGDAAPGGPWNAARVAIEMADFHEAIERLEPNVGELDVPNAVYLSLALDAVGRRNEAVTILQDRVERGGTDAMGTLAGRLKRMWWAEGIEKHAVRALELYQEAYDRSAAAGDTDQAFYHGINVAFMKLAFEQDDAEAREMATQVLAHCGRVESPDAWCLATMGEANLYLGDREESLSQYERAVDQDPEPSHMETMFLQAMRVADVLDDESVQGELRRIFRQEED